jgi:ABC-type glycerol-3-phosphate transport system substrate-binding protein
MKYALALVFAAALTGCSLLPSNVATLWTNRPEFTTYTELFNASQNRYKVQIVYKALPTQSLASSAQKPDLVVGDRIVSSSAITQFSPLDQIIGAGQVDPAQFYRAILATGRREGRQFLLPVSFDLPMMLYSTTAAAAGEASSSITITQLRQESLDFQKKSTADLRIVGFSPLWNPSFLVQAVAVAGADFHQTPRGDLAWDEQKLQAGISSMRDWISTVDGGADSEASFRERYLYDPVYKLLSTGRILYYYMPASQFSVLPQDKWGSIHFKWLSENGQIRALENVEYVGVPNRARNKGAAYAFLQWFFQPSHQTRMLEASRFEQLKSFGISGGFSALHVVNERDFPQYYPELLGRIPSATSLTFPKSLPTDWGDLETNVLVPWLEHEVAISATDQQLDSRLKAWRLQKPLP